MSSLPWPSSYTDAFLIHLGLWYEGRAMPLCLATLFILCWLSHPMLGAPSLSHVNALLTLLWLLLLMLGDNRLCSHPLHSACPQIPWWPFLLCRSLSPYSAQTLAPCMRLMPHPLRTPCSVSESLLQITAAFHLRHGYQHCWYYLMACGLNC